MKLSRITWIGLTLLVGCIEPRTENSCPNRLLMRCDKECVDVERVTPAECHCPLSAPCWRETGHAPSTDE